MRSHKVYGAEELRYLTMLARQYPTVQAAGAEIINLLRLRALLPVPGT